MFRFIVLFFVSLFIVHPACAYESKQLNAVFYLLSHTYVKQIDIKKIALTESKQLSYFDKKIKVFNSDTKFFLYYNNHLMDTLVLPNNDNTLTWGDFLTQVLSSAENCSPQIAQHIKQIEQRILKGITSQLDVFSRIENAPNLHTVFDYTLKNDVLYVKPTIFSSGSSAQLKNIISQFPKAKGLVLDLRNNHGGQFDEAIKTADLFLDEALITYSTEKNQPNRFYTSHKGDILDGKPIVILTNEKTASAAEIVAASLSDQSRAILIGTKTYGKGTIQHLYPLEQKTFFVTSGYFFSPSGKKINEKGIKPHICTGVNASCQSSDNENIEKDILIAIDYIKQQVG